ncbi:hypothetical protein [Paenibacillus abyssi]|uniref:Uncharacterized protein n=1 Tax=Paenibacillus abyssi TaxID=1340531 RepID=A0A917CRA5_9BACL|nr:hypothetical protein [Paenibacillus abyssi]GGF95693.1 hypothetical protein GCM10010916_11240 [Paenibacillus abyssi]
MSLQIMPLDDFMNLETEEQVEKLKRWKMDYTLKDIREVWGFKHSAQYYMLLKKLRIYERVVNKSDKFFPEQMMPSRTGSEPYYGYQTPAAQPAYKFREDHFDYQLNTTLSGPEIADRLERIAYFLRGEHKQVTVRLTLAAESEDGLERDESMAIRTNLKE